MNEYAIAYSLRMHARALERYTSVMGPMEITRTLNEILMACAAGHPLNTVIGLVPPRYRLPDDFDAPTFCKEMIRILERRERTRGHPVYLTRNLTRANRSLPYIGDPIE